MHCRQYRLGAVSAVSRDARLQFFRAQCERCKNIFGTVKQIESKLLFTSSRYIILVVASKNSALQATLQMLPRKVNTRVWQLTHSAVFQYGIALHSVSSQLHADAAVYIMQHIAPFTFYQLSYTHPAVFQCSVKYAAHKALFILH